MVLPQARPAVLGGALVVAVHLLAEFGAFAMLRFQTFTTAIYDEYHLSFDGPAASLLATVLVALCVVLVAGELRLRGSALVARVGTGAPRAPTRRRLGRATLPVLAAFTLLAAASLGLPIATLAFWLLRGSSAAFPVGSLAAAALSSVKLGLIAAALTTALALPVAVLAVRRRGRLAAVIERSVFLAYALPGVVVALALIVVSVHAVRFVYQTTALLEVAYAILFLPLALVAVRAALEQVTPGLEQMARSLGCPPWRATVRVTVPLVAPGLGAAAALVFLSTVTELTATLLLVPIGTDTLATGFWTQTTNLAYGAAAP